MAVQYRKDLHAVSQFRSFAVSQFHSFAMSIGLAATLLLSPSESNAVVEEILLRCDGCGEQQMLGKALSTGPRIGRTFAIVFDGTNGNAKAFDVFHTFENETGTSYKDADPAELSADYIEAFKLYKDMLANHNITPPEVVGSPKPQNPTAPMPEMMIPVPSSLNGISTASVRDVTRNLPAMHAVSNYIRNVKMPSGYLQARAGVQAFLKKIMKEAPVQETVVFVNGDTLGFVLINPFGSEPYAVIEDSAVTKDGTIIPGAYDAGGLTAWRADQRDGAVLRYGCGTFYTSTDDGELVPQTVCWHSLRP